MMQRITEMNPTVAEYVDVNGSKLFYEMAGEGEVLVLVHAGFVDSRMWNAQWSEFAQHFRVVRYDMFGYGKSSPVVTPTAQRDDLYQLLKHLNIEQAHLVGCSQGGGVVLDFALDHPNMVKSLVLVSTVPGGFEFQ